MNFTPHCLAISIQNLSNCWKTLKTNKPQRSDEIYASVTVVKTEKIICMRARLNPLLFFNGQSAAKLRIEEGSTTMGVYPSRVASVWLFEMVNYIKFFLYKTRIYRLEVLNVSRESTNKSKMGISK